MSMERSGVGVHSSTPVPTEKIFEPGYMLPEMENVFTSIDAIRFQLNNPQVAVMINESIWRDLVVKLQRLYQRQEEFVLTGK